MVCHCAVTLCSSIYSPTVKTSKDRLASTRTPPALKCSSRFHEAGSSRWSGPTENRALFEGPPRKGAYVCTQIPGVSTGKNHLFSCHLRISANRRSPRVCREWARGHKGETGGPPGTFFRPHERRQLRLSFATALFLKRRALSLILYRLNIPQWVRVWKGFNGLDFRCRLCGAFPACARHQRLFGLPADPEC